MPNLYQLPSGDWINPADIRAITAYPPRDLYGANVQVDLIGGGARVVFCESYEEARAVRDRVAAKRNEARGEVADR